MAEKCQSLERAEVVQALQLALDVAILGSEQPLPFLPREIISALSAINLVAAALGIGEVTAQVQGHLVAGRRAAMDNLERKVAEAGLGLGGAQS